MRLVPIILAIIFMVAGCQKKYAGDESTLYGTWVKGPNFGDTLWFTSRNNQQVMRQAMSFNAGLVVYKESEFRYGNDKLSIKLYAPTSDEYVPISSFKWTNQESEFSIVGIELYSFLSSTSTIFTYHKIN